MINLILDSNVFKILGLFSLSPGSRFNRNDIKNRTKLNNVPLEKALKIMLKSNIIKREKRNYSLNFENDNTKIIIDMISTQYKQFREIPFDIYLLITDMSYLLSAHDIEAFLFGSYAKLVYSDKSDIDIAILFSNSQPDITKNLKKLEKKYNKSIELHFFEKNKFYNNKKDPIVKDILKNGIRML